MILKILFAIYNDNILSWAMLQRPDSQWVCEIVTNVTFFINLTPDHPIGTGDFFRPDYVLENKGLYALVCDTYHNSYRPPYQDNSCFF